MNLFSLQERFMKEAIIKIYTKEELGSDETMTTTFNAKYDKNEDNGVHTVIFEDETGDSRTKTKLTFDDNQIEIEKDGTEKVTIVIGKNPMTLDCTFLTMYGELPMRVKSNYYNMNVEDENSIKISMGYNLMMTSQLIGDICVDMEIKIKRGYS